MTVKEILSEITDYISLSPIANKYYGRSRQWLYHKVNEDIINKVQYKLSDEEIDILISALDDIYFNIFTVVQNLEDFKSEREYLKIPEEDRKLLESYQEQINELNQTDQYEKIREIIKKIYASETSVYVIEYADCAVNERLWYLLNLKNEPIKYEGNYLKTIVNNVFVEIIEKVEAESRKKKRNKVKDDFDEDDDDSDDIDIPYLQQTACIITCKIYHQLNNLIIPKLLQERINKLLQIQTISSLGNIEISEIEKRVYENIEINN